MMPHHYIARLQLRAARAHYIDVRPFQHSDPERYRFARLAYATAIVRCATALALRPRIPQSPLSRNRHP
jgi:hypothetical protein